MNHNKRSIISLPTLEDGETTQEVEDDRNRPPSVDLEDSITKGSKSMTHLNVIKLENFYKRVEQGIKGPR